MKEINVSDYLSEADTEIKNLMNEDNLIYIIASCSCGKSYWIKNYLMNEYKVLNVNFLNVLNLQNFKDSFVEGKSGAERLDGSISATINIQNLQYVEAMYDVLVIDEIQKVFDVNFRNCIKFIPEIIKKYKEAGKKVIILTGTPLLGLNLFDELGFSTIRVNKENLTKKDKYFITFVKGLNKSNVCRVIQSRVNTEGFIVIANQRRDNLCKNFSRNGITYDCIKSDDKLVEGTRLNKLVNGTVEDDTIKYTILDEDGDTKVFLSTSVMVEGVNVNDTERIEVITWLDEINTPMNIIQAAGRMRSQSKRIFIGYNDESDFNYSTIRMVREISDDTDLLDSIESALASEFNTAEDWENYLNEYTPKCSIVFKDINDYIMQEDGDSSFNKSKTNWTELCKEATRLYKEGNTRLVAKRLDYDSEEVNGFKFVEAPNGKSIWVETTNPDKARLLFNLLETGFDIKNFSEDEIKLSTEVIKYTKILHKGLRKSMYEIDKNGCIYRNKGIEVYIDSIIHKTISPEDWNTIVNDTFSYIYKIDGVEVDVSNPEVAARYMKDKKKMIDKPTEILNNFKKTMVNILSSFLGRDLTADRLFRKTAIEGVDLEEALRESSDFNINDELSQDVKEYKAYQKQVKALMKGENKGKAVGKAIGKSLSEKYCLISDESVKFKTREEMYNYYTSNLNGTVGFNSFEKKGIWKKDFKKL